MRLAKVLLIAAKIVLALSSILRAEIVKVRCVVGRQCTPLACSTVYAYGSGVTFGELRDGRVAVLTCSHVIRGASSVSLFWHNQAVVPCQVLADGGPDGLDVALLAARLEPAPTDCKPLLADRPANDAEVWVCGFPGSRSYSVLRGTLFGTSLRVRERIEQGMSGGGVFTRDGLAGIVWGCEAYRPCNGEYTPSWLIRPWIEKRIGYVPSCPTVVDGDSQSSYDGRRRGDTPSDGCGCDGLKGKLSSIEDRLRKVESMLEAAGPGRSFSPFQPDSGSAAGIQATIQSIESRIASISVEVGAIKKSRSVDESNMSRLVDTTEKIANALGVLQSDVEKLKAISFPVRTLKPDGSVFSEEVVKLGDPIELRLVPRKPQP